MNYLCVFERKECVCSDGRAVLTVLELFEVLSFGKMEMTLVLTSTVSIQICRK